MTFYDHFSAFLRGLLANRRFMPLFNALGTTVQLELLGLATSLVANMANMARCRAKIGIKLLEFEVITVVFLGKMMTKPWFDPICWHILRKKKQMLEKPQLFKRRPLPCRRAFKSNPLIGKNGVSVNHPPHLFLSVVYLYHSQMGGSRYCFTHIKPVLFPSCPLVLRRCKEEYEARCWEIWREMSCHWVCVTRLFCGFCLHYCESQPVGLAEVIDARRV